MAEKLVRIEQRGLVGYLTLEDAGAMNALSEAMAEQFLEALVGLQGSSRAIVVTGAGRAFCAGARLSEGMDPDDPFYDAGGPLESHFNPMIAAIAGAPMPILASVNGVAAGGGIGLALACDMVFASENARFVPAFGRLGLSPDCGVSQVLTEVVGRLRAAEILMIGEPLDAKRAMACGLVNRVFDGADLEREVHAIARNLAEGPTRALALAKGLLRAAGSDCGPGLAREREAQRLAGRTADFREGLAAFLKHREPAFKGS